MKATKKEIVKSFESAYDSVPAWDIGRPQLEIINLEKGGEINGRVLDVGCGTGENTIYLSKLGYEVFGIDVASAAINKAIIKTSNRGAHPHFYIHDALQLNKLKLQFDTIIDSGLFHVYSNDARKKFVKSISSVLRTGGTYLTICFSEYEPGDWGPRRVTQKEIQDAFKNGFRINYIREATFQTNRPQGEVKAWLASIKKI